MNTRSTRRSFLKRAALTGGALAATRLLPVNILRADQPSNTLNCVQIGCGIRSQTHLNEVIIKHNQNLVAVVDPDPAQIRRAMKQLADNGRSVDKIQTFSDYRQMFDKIGKQVDAVFITAPNHHHYPAALMALEAGRNVYCEKPLCHTVGEARALRKKAADSPKIATQIGTQGHCMEGYRLLCEYVWAGAIGQITETHSWTDRANGGVGPRPPALPAPPELHWDSWIGPAPYRDYHADLHPHEWHGWYDFGNGSIGNMGCHVLDGVFWALKVEHPTSIEMEMVRGGSDERYPLGSRIRWDVPARGDMAPFKAYWYEGLNATTTEVPHGSSHAAVGDARNLPPILADLQKQYPDEALDLHDGATIYVGDKGVIWTGTYGMKMHILPWTTFSERPKPPRVLPRPKDVFTDFITACQKGRTDTAAPFDYGTRLTEFAILGNLAQKAGLEQRVDWDGANMKVTNMPHLNAWVKRKSRHGWTV